MLGSQSREASLAARREPVSQARRLFRRHAREVRIGARRGGVELDPGDAERSRHGPRAHLHVLHAAVRHDRHGARATAQAADPDDDEPREGEPAGFLEPVLEIRTPGGIVEQFLDAPYEPDRGAQRRRRRGPPAQRDLAPGDAADDERHAREAGEVGGTQPEVASEREGAEAGGADPAPADGDTLFSLALGSWEGEANVTILGALAADATAEAILSAVRRATGAAGFPAVSELESGRPR